MILDLNPILKQKDNERCLRIASRILMEERLKSHEVALKVIDEFYKK